MSTHLSTHCCSSSSSGPAIAACAAASVVYTHARAHTHTVTSSLFASLFLTHSQSRQLGKEPGDNGHSAQDLLPRLLSSLKCAKQLAANRSMAPAKQGGNPFFLVGGRGTGGWPVGPLVRQVGNPAFRVSG